MRDRFEESLCKEFSLLLAEIGIDAERLIFLGKGFSTAVFDTGNNQVVKILNKDVVAEENCVFRPLSEYVLQPVCVCDNVCGMYEVAVFPKLRTEGVKEYHSKVLKFMLAKQGYLFADGKLENVGLSSNGVPYVIDSDAVCKLDGAEVKKSHFASIIKWAKSQWSEFACKVFTHLDADISKAKSWKFSETYNVDHQVEKSVSIMAEL
ncbi:MAG: hypothetical protein K0R98_709 [Rickettsiaceae bacterium]|nr:hypothetical protein [Rickettsiaceae bacterium]